MTISSWSGGKDSAFACYQAMLSGVNIRYLLNFISRESQRCCFHGLEKNLLALQAERMGIPLVQREVSSDMENYEKEFKEAVLELKEEGIKKMVFGDIYLDEHKEWVQRVTGEIGIKAVEPLWGRAPEEIARDFVKTGFKAVIVSGRADLLEEEFIGRLFDDKVIEELKKRNICPCGENGEFHTLVVDGPIFKKKIKINKSRVITRESFAKYHFLDIKEYE